MIPNEGLIHVWPEGRFVNPMWVHGPSCIHPPCLGRIANLLWIVGPGGIYNLVGDPVWVARHLKTCCLRMLVSRGHHGIKPIPPEYFFPSRTWSCNDLSPFKDLNLLTRKQTLESQHLRRRSARVELWRSHCRDIPPKRPKSLRKTKLMFNYWPLPLAFVLTLFWHSGPGGRGRPFWDFVLGDLGARGPRDFCTWRFQSQE